MNVASLALSTELHELSEWETYPNTPDFLIEWWYFEGQSDPLNINVTEVSLEKAICPAYDLGYLLRKLPQLLKNGQYLLMECGAGYAFGYAEYGELVGLTGTADTPEDAAARLCIELFKQGILKKGGEG